MFMSMCQSSILSGKMTAKSSDSSLSKEEMAEKSLIFCSFAVRSITYAAMLPVAQLDEPKWGMSQLAKKLRLTISC